MPSNVIIEAIAPLIGMTVLGTVVLTGMFMRMRYKARMAAIQAAPESQAEAISQVQDQIHALSEEITELSERVDFAERLLTQGRNAEAPADEPTPI